MTGPRPEAKKYRTLITPEGVLDTLVTHGAFSFPVLFTKLTLHSGSTSSITLFLSKPNYVDLT